MELTKTQLERAQWTQAKADAAAPFVSRKPDGTYWVGDRRLLLRDDTEGMDRALEEVYEDSAPNIEYLAFLSAVQQKAVGIPRQYAKDWLFRQEGYQLYQPTRKVSSSRAILSNSPSTPARLVPIESQGGGVGPTPTSSW